MTKLGCGRTVEGRFASLRPSPEFFFEAGKTAGCRLSDCVGADWRMHMCSSHYHRWKRYGDPLAGGRPRGLESVGKDPAAKRAFVEAYKLEHGCADCGYNQHPAALDFDHLPGTVKVRDIKGGQQLGWAALMEEIAKCEVVCANCHRIRTVSRNGEVKLSVGCLSAVTNENA